MGGQNFLYKFFALFFELFFLVRYSFGDGDLKATLIDNWSKYGNFGQISGVSVDKSGNVYVFHRGGRNWDMNSFTENNIYRQRDDGPIKNNTIVILDPNTGAVIKETGASLFYLPHGLTVDYENNIWVTDVAMHQVFKFPPLDLNSNTSSLGKPIITLGTAFEPGGNDKENHFCKPTDVVVDKYTGDFFVSDGYCNSRIIKYVKDGREVLKWGRPQNQNQGERINGYTLFLPHALALDDVKKILYVADRENRRIVAYNSSTGHFLAEYAKDLLSPIYSVAYCPFHGGLLYALSTDQTAETSPYHLPNAAPNRVAVYDVNSRNQVYQFSRPDGFFSRAHDIALSPNGNASYVVDLSHGIWKFKIEFHETHKTTNEVKDNTSFSKIVPTSLKDDDFLGGTNIAIGLVTLVIAITLLVFLYHIQKRKGAYRRSEMRGLILDDDEDEVVAGSQGVPEALQKCHSQSRELEKNQSEIMERLSEFSALHQNFTLEVAEIKNVLRTVQDRLKSSPDQFNNPQYVKELSNSVASFGSQIKDLGSTVATLKDQNGKLDGAVNNLVTNVTEMKVKLTELASDHNEKSSFTDKDFAVEKEKIFSVINQVSANLSNVNYTLSEKLQWTADEQSKDHKLIGSLEEMNANVTARVQTLEGLCAKESESSRVEVKANPTPMTSFSPSPPGSPTTSQYSTSNEGSKLSQNPP